MRNALLVGTNQTKFLVWGTLAEALSNIYFDYGLIYGHFGLPAYGFNGAAYASILAEGIGLVVISAVIYFMQIHKSLHLTMKLTFDKKIVRLVLIQSLPLILQFAISIMSWEYFYLMIEHHGERALSISNTMRNIFGLTGIFSWAFAATTNAMVSNIIGQQKHEEVLPLIGKITKLSFSISLAIVILINLAPEIILSVYGQSEGFISEAIPVIRVISVALLMMSFSTIWLNAVTGTGNTMVNLIIEFITIILYCIYVYVVLVYLNLPINWGWGSEIVYWVSMFSMAFWYMKSGRWKGKII
jgi:Na+-driven multidrug efflux pump